MKLNEIVNLSDGDIPIIFDLMQSILDKGGIIHYKRFRDEDFTVKKVQIDYDDIREVHTLTVSIHSDQDPTLSAIAWQIPRMTDRLILKKQGKDWVFCDPEIRMTDL